MKIRIVSADDAQDLRGGSSLKGLAHASLGIGFGLSWVAIRAGFGVYIIRRFFGRSAGTGGRQDDREDEAALSHVSYSCGSTRN